MPGWTFEFCAQALFALGLFCLRFFSGSVGCAEADLDRRRKVYKDREEDLVKKKASAKSAVVVAPVFHKGLDHLKAMPDKGRAELMASPASADSWAKPVIVTGYRPSDLAPVAALYLNNFVKVTWPKLVGAGTAPKRGSEAVPEDVAASLCSLFSIPGVKLELAQPQLFVLGKETFIAGHENNLLPTLRFSASGGTRSIVAAPFVGMCRLMQKLQAKEGALYSPLKAAHFLKNLEGSALVQAAQQAAELGVDMLKTTSVRFAMESVKVSKTRV